MAGRGDNNKKGSSGRGGSNQSNQAFPDADHGKSNHNKKQTGGKRSEPQPRSADQDANRDQHLGSADELQTGKRKGMDM
ncbi:MAG TPA: hypothetical protein VD993_15905 [Chitinophagaceae bacterium]|nr:hypothetical protein [Chitinophagaceae bacterium]